MFTRENFSDDGRKITMEHKNWVLFWIYFILLRSKTLNLTTGQEGKFVNKVLICPKSKYTRLLFRERGVEIQTYFFQIPLVTVFCWQT